MLLFGFVCVKYRINMVTGSKTSQIMIIHVNNQPNVYICNVYKNDSEDRGIVSEGIGRGL